MVKQTNIILPEDFVTRVYELQKLTPKFPLRSNVKGWQSTQYNNFNKIPWAEPVMNQCFEAFDLTHLSITHLWFNINPTGSYHNWHSHGRADCVGVCYIQVPKNSGNLEFKKDDKIAVIEPCKGLVLTFPSGLDHRVTENKSVEDRITMAFNLDNKR